MRAGFTAVAVVVMLVASACGISTPRTLDASSGHAAASATIPTTPTPPAATPTSVSSSMPAPTPTLTPVPTRSLTPTIAAAPSNDEPPGTVIPSLPFVDTVNTTQAQIHAMERASTCGSGTQSVWYSFTAPRDATLAADTLDSDYDTILDVWEGSLTTDRMDPGFERLKPLACNDNTNGSVQSGIVFATVTGQDYVIRVSTALDATGGTLVFRLSTG